MNLKTFTDIAEMLDIKRPNATKFVAANLHVTHHEINGKSKKLIDIDFPKNKKAIDEYIELNRDGVAYRGENFSRNTKKSVKVKPEVRQSKSVPRGTSTPIEPEQKKEVQTASLIVSKSRIIKPEINKQPGVIIRTTSDEILDSNLPVERLILEFSESLPPEKLKKYEKIVSELSKLGIVLIPEYEAQSAKVYTDLQAKRIDVEKKRTERDKTLIQISKEEGKTIPTDMAATAWSKYGDAAQLAFKQSAELMVNSIASEYNISNDDRSHYLNQLNEATFDGVEEQKKMGFQLLEQIVKDQTGISLEKKN